LGSSRGSSWSPRASQLTVLATERLRVPAITPKGEGGAGGADELSAAGSKAADYTRQWLRLMSGLFDAPGVTAEEKGDRLLVRQANPDGTMMTCEVDRKTLTPRRLILRDDRGAQRFALTLSRYTDSGTGIVWPRRIEASSESGQILIELRDVEINGEIPPTAFKAPARAEKLPENPS